MITKLQIINSHNCWGKEEECLICTLHKLNTCYDQLNAKLDLLEKKIDKLLMDTGYIQSANSQNAAAAK